MLSVLLIADDLTGALDSVVPFVIAGRNVAAAVDHGGIAAALAGGPDILAVNSDSRGLKAIEAAGRMQAIWDALGDNRPQLVIKKIDSRLAGHPAAETHALLKASGRTEAWVCPAVPDMGRIVLDGKLVGEGVSDPIRLADLFPASNSYRLVDAADPVDLQQIAASIGLHAASALAVGARGLAQAIAALEPNTESPSALPRARLPLVMAIGSCDPATDRQIAYLQATGAPVVEVAAPDGRLSMPMLDDAPILLIRTTDAGGSWPADLVASRFAEGVSRLVNDRKPASLLLSGGATAMAVIRALGIQMLTPAGEIAPGIPISRAAGWDDTAFITKSGGFGEPAALSRFIASLHPAPTRAGLMPV